ncbi:MAG: LysR substrate-binding domain-containing protein, partial [Xanthobacteraceae bacterium]
ITAPILFGRLHVLPIVTAFLADYTDVTARLMLLDRPVDLVEEGLDVAIRIGPLPDSSAIATRLGALRRVMVASPDYLKRRGVPASIDDLAAHDVVMFGGIGRWEFRKGTMRVTPRLSVTTAEAAIDAAATGTGITRVLSYQAVDALEQGRVVQVLAALESEETPVHLLYPGGAHPPPKLRAFIDFAVPRLRRALDDVEEALKR